MNYPCHQTVTQAVLETVNQSHVLGKSVLLDVRGILLVSVRARSAEFSSFPKYLHSEAEPGLALPHFHLSLV